MKRRSKCELHRDRLVEHELRSLWREHMSSPSWFPSLFCLFLMLNLLNTFRYLAQFCCVFGITYLPTYLPTYIHWYTNSHIGRDTYLHWYTNSHLGRGTYLHWYTNSHLGRDTYINTHYLAHSLSHAIIIIFEKTFSFLSFVFISLQLFCLENGGKPYLPN